MWWKGTSVGEEAPVKILKFVNILVNSCIKNLLQSCLESWKT